MKKLIILIITALSVSCYGQVTDDYLEYVKQQQQAMQEMSQDEQQQMAKMAKEYEDYVKAETEAYNNFLKEMEAKWGKGNVAESTQKEWVEYTNGGNARSIVDFESGRVTVEVLTIPGKPVDKSVLAENVKELLISKGKTKDYDSSVEKAEDLQDTPVLEDQVATPSGEVITASNVDEGAREIVENANVEVVKKKGADGVEHEVVSVTFDLMPDHISKRAVQYLDDVNAFCSTYNVEQSLAFAVIQTESSFNPKAKSHVPAYGLMQIVPKSAGADCARSLKKNFDKPTANYLYDPKNNIEMGVHYLHLMRNRYYKDVTDKDKQNLCVIASYNTGAGNVARALRGDTNIKKAVPQINEMTYDELYNFFRQKLMKETQNYVKNVTERYNNFKKWMK